MIFNTENLNEAIKAVEYVSSLAGKLVEIKEYNLKRTKTQQDSIYLYCEWVAKKLNQIGQSCNKHSVIQDVTIELTWTKDLVKSEHWIPIQKVLFDTEHFSDLERNQVSVVYDVLNKHYSDNFGFHIPFPDRHDFNNNFLNHYKNYI
jgi:hypothetical protein